MNIETLNEEQFAAVKELSGIQTQISEGRATLAELKVSTQEYLAEREKLTTALIDKVFKDSEKRLREIGKNHEQLKAYHNEVRGFAKELTNHKDAFAQLTESFTKMSKNEKEKLEKRTIELSEIEQSLKEQKKEIADAYKQLEKDREEYAKVKIRLEDERKTLERAFKRLEI